MHHLTRPIRSAAVLGVVLAGGTLAACGDDTPSHTAFEDHVAEICASSGERHAGVLPEFDFAAFDPATSDLAEIVPVIEGHLAIGRETSDQLERVDGPDEDERRLSTFLELADRIHELGDAEIEAAEAGDRARFTRLTDEEGALQEEATSDATFAGC
jgi:hypothetical protein